MSSQADTDREDGGMSRQMADAWVFLSIGDAAGPRGEAAPSEVLWMADANFHAVPSWEVVEESVSRLLAAGLVEASDVLRLSAEGRKRYDEAWPPELGHIERVLRLGETWERQGYPPPAPKSWAVPPTLR